MAPRDYKEISKYWNGVLVLMGDETVDWTMFNLSPFFYQENMTYPYVDVFKDWGQYLFPIAVVNERIN